MSQFQKLMEELNTLQSDQEAMTKALPADDGKDEDKIQAAAAEGGSDHSEPDGDEGMGGEGDGDGDEGKPMAKSFKFTLEDGTEVEAEDGTELVKSLITRMDTNESTMAKALETTVGLIKAQGDMIKSLTDQVKKLSGEGRGRKAVVSVVEKPGATAHTDTMAKSHQPEGMNADEFFAKALTAQKEGRISGTEIALAETMLNRGQAIPPSIVQRVMQ